MTKFGIFSLSQFPDQATRVDSFDKEIEQFELADRIGFDTVWVAEHLFSTYGVIASTQVLAAAIARRTERVRIGTAVSVIPFNHPLRTASDFAAVDCFSHGRLNFGAGRAYQPHEFIGLDLPMDKSREMFDEGMDMILRAWTEEKITHKGEFWTVAEEVEVLPKPVQEPHPPIYMAAISPPSFIEAAERGWNLQLASPFSYRMYRESWVDKIEENLEQYARRCEELGRDPLEAERAILLPFFVASTEAEAREVYAHHVEWFYNKVSGHERIPGKEQEIVKGYEVAMVEGRKTKELGLLHFEHLSKHGAAIASDPGGCVERLSMLKERLGITEFILWFNLGGMSHGATMDAMRMTMDQVAPRV